MNKSELADLYKRMLNQRAIFSPSLHVLGKAGGQISGDNSNKISHGHEILLIQCGNQVLTAVQSNPKAL